MVIAGEQAASCEQPVLSPARRRRPAQEEIAANMNLSTASRARVRKRLLETNDASDSGEDVRTAKIPRADALLRHAGRPYPPDDQRYGVIEKISLKNFMCHSQLEFEFAPRVNFIIGRNGSGKSAVLTAVMAGLGGKASATNRGRNSAGLIQAGKHAARIEITLANRGSGAYKPDELGPSIIVTRTLRIPSGGSYEIRSHDRRIVSTKREDLQTILRHLNIQVDNPIVILNQETSRNFLQSKSAKDKYQFFMKATQLEEVKDNYSQANEDLARAKNTLQNKTELLEELAKQKSQYELLLKVVANITKERQKVERLEGEILWSIVSKHESIVRDAAAQLENYEAQLSQLQTDIDEFSKNMQLVANDKTEKAKQLDAIRTETVDLANETEVAKSTVLEMKEKFRNLEAEQKKVKREIQELQGDRRAIQDELDRPQNIDDGWREEKARRETEIKHTADKIEKLRRMEPEATATERAARKELLHTEEAVREQREIVFRLESDAQRLRSRIATAKAATKDAINRFGPNTSQLLKDIANERRFHVRPKGPIGAFINVRDDEWAYAVEQFCWGTLKGWMVDNNHDYKLLKQLLERNQMKSTIYTRRLGRPRYECPFVRGQSGSRCLAHVIATDDDDVFNLLVDVNRINQVLVYDRSSDALAVMKHVDTVPKDCFLAIDAQFNRTFPAPKYRYYANDWPLQVRYLSRNTDPVSALEAELDPLTKQELSAKKQLELAKRAQVAAEANVREARNVYTEITRGIAKHEENLRQLRDFEEPVPVDRMPLQNEIAKLDEQIADREKVLAEMQESLKKMIDSIRPAVAELKEKEILIKESEVRALRVQEEMDKLRQRVEEFSREQKNSESRKNWVVSVITKLKKERENKERALEIATLAAKKKRLERVTTRRSESDLRLELQTLTQQIAHMEKTQPDPVATQEKFDRCSKQHEQLSRELEEVQVYMSELERLTLKRLNLYNTVRDLYCFLINTLFNSLMMYEQFHAELHFDHDAQTLEMHVPAIAGEENSQSRDVRGLSGGERSYSTVCFICSLWVNTASTPFRVLDEFDIFMDMSKRRKSLQMLLQVCQLQTNCQFIFLTPLEMPKLDALQGDFVKVQIMPEPKRNLGSASQRAS